MKITKGDAGYIRSQKMKILMNVVLHFGLAESIKLLPQRSVSKQVAKDVEEKANLLTRIYDLMFSDEKNIIPVDCIVVSRSTVFGYTSNKKVDIDAVSMYVKQYLTANQLDKVSVKIFNNYTAFITRAEGLNNIMAIEKADTKELEEAIRQVILNISL